MVTSAQLLSVINRFAETPILVVGDLIVDHYIWGSVSRISPEAPVVVVEVTQENFRPGGAGNVVSNLSALGAIPSVFGVVGDDEQGRSLLKTISDRGACTKGIVVDASRPTTVKTRVIAHAQQVVRVDRESQAVLDDKLMKMLCEAFASRLPNTKGVLISDYGKGVIGKPVFEIIKSQFDSGILGYQKIPVVVDPKSPNYPIYSAATVIKPNRVEAEEASGMKISNRDDAVKAGEMLLKRWGCEMVLITLGHHGMVLVSRVTPNTPSVLINTVAREVYDVSGAGDTVSAVLGLALAVNATPEEAAVLSNIAAGIVVGEIGTVAVTKQQLQAAVKDLES